MANAADGGRSAPIVRAAPRPKVVKKAAYTPERRRTSPYTPPRPRVSTPRPKRTTSVQRRVTRSYSSGGGNSSGNTRRSSGSSSGSRSRSTPSSPPSSTALKITPPAPPKPVAPTNSRYLQSDSTYQRQLAAYAKALTEFQADQGLARTDYDTGYQGTNRDIGLAKQTASNDLENDYASRGLLKSSLYNTALGDLNTQYQNQYNDLSKQRTSFLDQLGQESTKFGSEQGVQKQNAMQEALRRRAEKYNI